MKFHEQERQIRHYALCLFLAGKVFFIKVITLLIFLALNEGAGSEEAEWAKSKVPIYHIPVCRAEITRE